MAENAPQTQYREEFIATFEQQHSLLRDATTTEAVFKGNVAKFLVAGSGGATAATRGINGLIPARADSLTQTDATLVEWHDLVRKTGFNVFESQGDQRAIMQMTTMGVINRKIDTDILTTLDGATVDTGTAATATLAMAVRSKAILGVASVPSDGNICAVISPAFEAYLLQIPEFSSADYVTRKPVDSGETGWDDQPGFYRWLGVKWLVHPNVTGVGTTAEKCHMFHKNAIGHAANTGEMESKIGVDDEQGYSWARASIFMGAALLQNSGVVVMNHDGSAYVGE